MIWHTFCEMIITIKLMTHFSPKIVNLFFFFFQWECLRSSLLANSNIQNNIINYGHHALHWIPRAYSPYNWKLVPFDQHLPLPPMPQSLRITLLLSVSIVWLFLDSICICSTFLPLSMQFHLAQHPLGSTMLL